MISDHLNNADERAMSETCHARRDPAASPGAGRGDRLRQDRAEAPAIARSNRNCSSSFISRLPSGAVFHDRYLTTLVKRHRDLRRARTRVACRLHAVLCELVPGGIGKEMNRQPAV